MLDLKAQELPHFRLTNYGHQIPLVVGVVVPGGNDGELIPICTIVTAATAHLYLVY